MNPMNHFHLYASLNQRNCNLWQIRAWICRVYGIFVPEAGRLQESRPALCAARDGQTLLPGYSYMEEGVSVTRVTDGGLNRRKKKEGYSLARLPRPELTYT